MINNEELAKSSQIPDLLFKPKETIIVENNDLQIYFVIR